jgi:DNA-binding Xre family transcriptional regulator
MNLIKIRSLAEKRDGGIRKLAKEIEMSEANLHRCIAVNKIQANDLEKIAFAFNVPIGYFFEDSHNGNITQKGAGNTASIYGNISLSNCQKEVEHLRELLEEKERTIQILINKN